MKKQRFLTGITTSGTPHLGNYVGSIRPSVLASQRTDVESYYFLADYHALIKINEPTRIQRSTLEIAASWLAAGLDPNKVVFYRQSDVPEIPELTWFLTCVIGKGVLNRAHAYKSSADKNNAAGQDPDTDVNAGLFMYPVLMGADILMFNAHQVPVGRDQIQHIEMARDMANSFNHRYGEHFVLPEAAIEDNVATLPGLDGRKMSKSYDNTIPLFSTREQLRKLINNIVTDSRPPGEPKEIQKSALFEIYQAFANLSETKTFEEQYLKGIGWGEAKQIVFERIDKELSPMREKYHSLLNQPGKIESILLEGSIKARKIATPFVKNLRYAVGLRDLQSAPKDLGKVQKVIKPSFKQYREDNGQFFFKLVDTQGLLLLQSKGFGSPKLAGQAVKILQANGPNALDSLKDQLEPMEPDQKINTLSALKSLLND